MTCCFCTQNNFQAAKSRWMLGKHDKLNESQNQAKSKLTLSLTFSSRFASRVPTSLGDFIIAPTMSRAFPLALFNWRPLQRRPLILASPSVWRHTCQGAKHEGDKVPSSFRSNLCCSAATDVKDPRLPIVLLHHIPLSMVAGEDGGGLLNYCSWPGLRHFLRPGGFR
ncbi:hypothetical protein LY78DRAFT_220665 [Colletotrichum sublineola]|nr:hypothetical protein LY78DRAFT_220665 [Colletotrichum sublineola]